MSPEEVQALVAENERLRAEVGVLRGRLVEVTGRLETALARIAELEQRKAGPPPFVKPSRPLREPRGPRKKRAAAHNRARPRMTPTVVVRHALARCPDCGYRLNGESIAYTREVIELPPPPPVGSHRASNHQALVSVLCRLAQPQARFGGAGARAGADWRAGGEPGELSAHRVAAACPRDSELSGHAAQLAIERRGDRGIDACCPPAVTAAGGRPQGDGAGQPSGARG